MKIKIWARETREVIETIDICVSEMEYLKEKKEVAQGSLLETEICEIIGGLDFNKNAGSGNDYCIMDENDNVIIPFIELPIKSEREERILELLRASINELYSSAEPWYAKSIPELIGSSKEELANLGINV